jgi:hypothetical protein
MSNKFQYLYPSSFRHRVSSTRNLGTEFPDIARQWHPTKNGALTPQHISSSSGRKVWWICAKGHEWQASPNARFVGRDLHGCPHCAKNISKPCVEWLDEKGIVAREITIMLKVGVSESTGLTQPPTPSMSSLGIIGTATRPYTSQPTSIRTATGHSVHCSGKQWIGLSCL